MSDPQTLTRVPGGLQGAPPDTTRRRRPSAPRRGGFAFRAAPYAYVAPFFIVFAAVGLFPLGFTLFISFYEWTLPTQSVDGATFVGLGNYTKLLFEDPVFWSSLANTFSIFLISTIPQLIAATFLAAVLDRNLRAKTFWRMGVLLPYIVAPVAVAIIFSAIFRNSQDVGLMNSLFELVGIPAVDWVADRVPSHIAVALMVNFRWTGYNTLILLAAMQAVPRDLYEAAAIDGAGYLRRFFNITLPSIKTTMIFVIITATMGGLRIFDEVRLFSPGQNLGGARGQFKTVVLYMYDHGFNRGIASNLGMAGAIAWVMFFIILIVTAINFLLSRRIADADMPRPPRRVRRRTKEAAR